MPRLRKAKKTPSILDHLRERTIDAQNTLTSEFPHIVKKLHELRFDLQDIRRHSAKIVSAAALAGAIFIAAPAINAIVHPPGEERQFSPSDSVQELKEGLSKILPKTVGALTPEIEAQAHQIIQDTLNINAVAELDGNHLNTTFGYIGAEQHLPRYPGDTIADHDELQFKGITAGRGAFGHFVPSKEQLTQEDIMKEKYYVAVQTLYLPNWNREAHRLKKWYKFRKILVVNPANGKAVVADIADAGPAAWTGKHFGGSPEVMAELELNRGKQKGAVLLFFIDERQQLVDLGPVEAKQGVYIAGR
jgi:hypothetical protein